MYLNILLLQHAFEACPGCFWTWAAWMLLPFLLGIFLGKWIWGKYAQQIASKEKTIKILQNKNKQNEKDFINLKFQLEEAQKDNKGLHAALKSVEGDKVVLSNQLTKIRNQSVATIPSPKTTDSAKKEEVVIPTFPDLQPADTSQTEESSSLIPKLNELTVNLPELQFFEYLKADNLKIIEGIGPKIEDILKKAGYENWKTLASADLNELKIIMHDAGPRYRIHSPTNWSQQAQLANEGKWRALIEYQNKLLAKNNDLDAQNFPTKLEKILVKKLNFSSAHPDDLKVIHRIDPATEKLLKNGGIANWQALIEAPIERLQKILEDGGEHYQSLDPSNWQVQATLAMQNQWVQLKKIQEEGI